MIVIIKLYNVSIVSSLVTHVSIASVYLHIILCIFRVRFCNVFYNLYFVLVLIVQSLGFGNWIILRQIVRKHLLNASLIHIVTLIE